MKIKSLTIPKRCENGKICLSLEAEALPLKPRMMYYFLPISDLAQEP